MNEYKYTNPNNFSEFENVTPLYRRTLLPWYMRFFSWAFMISGGIAIIALLFTLTSGDYNNSNIFGLDQLPHPYNILASTAVLAFGGITGYLLWTERKNALKVGQAFAITGTVICVITTIMSFTSHHSIFRLEIILLILFWRKLDAMEYDWEVTGVSRTGQD